MRIIFAVLSGLVLGVVLFGPIKEYWINAFNSKVPQLEQRVGAIEQYLVNLQREKEALDAKRTGK